MTTRRSIVIGDVHGCYDELMDLLDKCQVTACDRIISLGDILDRGPKIRESVDFFMKHEAILGNHEEKWLRRQETDRSIYSILEPNHFEWFKTLPKFLRLPEYTGPDGQPVVLIHAGCLPSVPLERQTDRILMHVSNVKPPGIGSRDDQGRIQHGYWRADTETWWTSKAPEGALYWASIYDGSNGFVVFGHSVFTEVAHFPHALGIDLGACFGRQLCALVLPDWRFVTVPAREDYRKSDRIKIFEVHPGIYVYS